MAGFNNSNNPFQAQVRLGPQYVQLVPGPPGPSVGGGSGYVTVQINGAPLAAETVLNFIGFDGADNPGVATNITLDFANANALGILPVPHGGTGLATLVAGAVLLGNGASPIGNVPPGTPGNVLTDTGAGWTSSPAASGSTPGGDLDGTATQQWVTMISGVNGAGGPVPLHVPLVQYDAMQASPTLGQLTTGAANAEPLVFVAQPSINPNAAAGGFRFELPAQAGSGAPFPRFDIVYGAPEAFCVSMGPQINRADQACLWLLPPANMLTPTTGTNFTLNMDGNGSLTINAIGGPFIAISNNGGAFLLTLLTGNRNMFQGAPTAPSGTDMFVQANSVTPPVQTNPPGSGGALWSTGGAANWMDTKATWTGLSPASSGTVNTQLQQFLPLVQYGRITTSGNTVTVSFPLPTSFTSVCLMVTGEIKIAVAGSGNALGDTFSDVQISTFKNVGGTVTQVGATSDLSPGQSDASLSGSSLSYTISTTNIVVTLTAVATSGTLGTADCTIYVDPVTN